MSRPVDAVGLRDMYFARQRAPTEIINDILTRLQTLFADPRSDATSITVYAPLHPDVVTGLRELGCSVHVVPVTPFTPLPKASVHNYVSDFYVISPF